MALQLVPLFLAAALSITHYHNSLLRQTFKSYESNASSFAAGISISYLFLQILPELHLGVQVINNWVFFSVLSGFTLFHLIEKHVQEHTHRLEKRREELKETHSAFFFAYHFLVGIVLVQLFSSNAFNGFLFFVPVFLYTLASAVSLSEVHEGIRGHHALRVFLSSSSVLGALLASFFAIPEWLFFLLFGFLGGVFFYVVIRESVPSERRGKSRFFLAGVLLYALALWALRAI